jgi:hypothetical protein
MITQRRSAFHNRDRQISLMPLATERGHIMRALLDWHASHILACLIIAGVTFYAIGKLS